MYPLLLKNLLTIGVFMISLLSFTFSQDVTLSLNGGNLDYSSTADIAGFQFAHKGCGTVASGGHATANGFTVSASGTWSQNSSFNDGANKKQAKDFAWIKDGLTIGSDTYNLVGVDLKNDTLHNFWHGPLFKNDGQTLNE